MNQHERKSGQIGQKPKSEDVDKIENYGTAAENGEVWKGPDSVTTANWGKGETTAAQPRNLTMTRSHWVQIGNNWVKWFIT